MAITFNLPVGQVVTDDFVKSDETYTGGTALELRASPYSAAHSTATHTGDGIYSFPAVDSGEYKVYTAAGTELTRFGIIKIGEGGAVLTTGNQTIGGSKTFSATTTFTSAVSTDTISERTSAAGVTVDGLQIKDAGIVTACTFTNIPSCAVAPTTANHLTNKTYVDDLVASVEISPYQYGGNIRRVVSSATEQAGAVYTTIAGAISSVGTTSATARYIIMLEEGAADAAYSNVFQLLHSACSKDYISFVGKSRNGTHLILGGTGDTASLTRSVAFENMTIYLTTEISGTRTYGSMKFINCTIYGYRSTYFANCELHNCDVVHANSYIPYLSSAGKCFGTTFAQGVTEDSYTGSKWYYDSYNTSPSMPTAPNLGS